VRIEDSILALGIPNGRNNTWALPHDVEISRTTLVVSESDGGPLAEAPRTFSAVSVNPQSFALGAHGSGPGRLVFSGCRFELAQDVEDDDEIYALENLEADAAVEVVSSQIGAGFAGWLAPTCGACTLTP
jgi:hypothetical protein